MAVNDEDSVRPQVTELEVADANQGGTEAKRVADTVTASHSKSVAPSVYGGRKLANESIAPTEN